MKVQVEYITQNVAMMSFLLSYNRLNRKTPIAPIATGLVSYLFSKWNETAFEEQKMWYWTADLETSRKSREDDGFCMSDDAFVVWINKLQDIGFLEYDNKAHRSRPYSTVRFLILDKWYKAWKDKKYVGGEFYSFLLNEGAIPSANTETPPKQPQSPPAEPKKEYRLLAYFKEELQRKASNLGLELILFNAAEDKAAIEIIALVTQGVETDDDREAKIWGFCNRAGENAIAGNGYLKSKFFPTAMLHHLASFNAQPHTHNQKAKVENVWIQEGELITGFVFGGKNILFPFPNNTDFRKTFNMKKNAEMSKNYTFFLNSRGCFFNRENNTFQEILEEKVKVGQTIVNEGYVWKKIESGQKWVRVCTISEYNEAKKTLLAQNQA